MCAVDRVNRKTLKKQNKKTATKKEELLFKKKKKKKKDNRTKELQHVNVGNGQGEALSLLSDVLKIVFIGQQHHSSSRVSRQ